MAEVVNLNRYRKKRARDDARKTAAENRVRFGRDKTELGQTRHDAEKAAKELEDKRLD